MLLCSASEQDTNALGVLLGRLIETPVTLLLEGDLGSGKSVFARGVGRGLGVPDTTPITSPTFTLMNHYPARLDFYHFDLYRLSDAEELTEIGFDQFAFGDGVAVVEWPQILYPCTQPHLKVEIRRLSISKRSFLFTCQGEVLDLVWQPLNSALRQELPGLIQPQG